MFDPTTQAIGAQPRFLPFNAAPNIAGFGYGNPQAYANPLSYTNPVSYPHPQLSQTQAQPQVQLQLVPVLTPQGWVGLLIGTLAQPISNFGVHQGSLLGYGYSPLQFQQQIPQIPFTWQQPQLPWQQQSPWQSQTAWQQPGFNQFIGQPFAGSSAH
jgi:hypothetical protein